MRRYYYMFEGYHAVTTYFVQLVVKNDSDIYLYCICYTAHIEIVKSPLCVNLYFSLSVTSVISKVVPNSEPKTPAPKTPAAKSGPGNRPRTPPPPPMLAPVVPILPPAPSPLPPPPTPATLLSVGPMLSPAASFKTPVRSVVTETVSTYVVSLYTLDFWFDNWFMQCFVFERFSLVLVNNTLIKWLFVLSFAHFSLICTVFVMAIRSVSCLLLMLSVLFTSDPR